MIRVRSLEDSGDPAYAFVMSSWVHSYAETACNQMGVDGYGLDGDIVIEYLREHVKKLVRSSQVRIAMLDSDNDTFVGWVCGDPRTQTIHYVYVKEAWREQGLSWRLVRELVKADAGQYTFMTHKHPGFRRAVERRGWRWRLLRP